MCSFCSAHIWPTATARNMLPELGPVLPPVCVAASATPPVDAARLSPLDDADTFLEARRFEKNFSLMARAEYLCSINIGELLDFVVLISVVVAVVVAGDDATAAVGLVYLAAVATVAAVAVCLLLSLLLLLLLLLMMCEQE